MNNQFVKCPVATASYGCQSQSAVERQRKPGTRYDISPPAFAAARIGWESCRSTSERDARQTASRPGTKKPETVHIGPRLRRDGAILGGERCRDDLELVHCCIPASYR